MLRNQDALNDEQVPAGQVPTHNSVGKQFKRLKTAEALSEADSVLIVTDTTVGERGVGFVDLANQVIAQNVNPQQAGMAAVLAGVIQAACQPNGAIHNAIHNACQPGGSVHQLVHDALDSVEARSDARRANRSRQSLASLIYPLPDRNGNLPGMFPPSLDRFWSMTAAVANQLLQFYNIIDLPMQATLDQKRRRLAVHCDIQLPTHA